MARKAPKMTDLVIEETSGVDHPAHLHEGWLVVKTAHAESVADVMNALPETLGAGMTEETTDEVTLVTEQIVEAEAGSDSDKEYMDSESQSKQEEDLAIAQARIAELEARLAELEGADESDEPMEMSADEQVVALAKSAPEPLRKALEDMQKAKVEAEAALAKEREDRADADAIAKAAADFSHLTLDPAKVGPALRRLAAQDADLAKSISDALLSADAQNESADIFTEVGKGFAPKGDAIHKMTSLAKAAVSEGKAATFEQALAQVASTNPALYNEYLTEKGA